MPVEHRYTVRAGTTKKSVLLYARDATDPTRGKCGLTPRDGTAAFVREGSGEAVRVALQQGANGEWRPGGLSEVDAELMPGVYSLAVPDAVFAPGSTRALLLARFQGAVVEPLDIDLVAYDPQDGWRIGLESLANKERHAFLRQALPSFTQMELALGVERERDLTRHLGEDGGE